jgi:hypothetical protein
MKVILFQNKFSIEFNKVLDEISNNSTQKYDVECDTANYRITLRGKFCLIPLKYKN